MRLAALIAVAAFAASAASASVDAAALRTSGDWRLSEVGGKIACTLTLTSPDQLRGFRAEGAARLPPGIPAAEDGGHLGLDDKGGIVLADAKAQPIVTFPVQAGEALARGPTRPRRPTAAPGGWSW